VESPAGGAPHSTTVTPRSTDQNTKVTPTAHTRNAAGGKDYDTLPVEVRVRGSSSAAQQQQKSLAVETKMPGNSSEEGKIEFMGACWVVGCPWESVSWVVCF